MEKDIDLYVPGRPRDENDHQLIYFTDPVGHKFEVHTGTMQDRIDYYKQERAHCNFLMNDKKQEENNMVLFVILWT